MIAGSVFGFVPFRQENQTANKFDSFVYALSVFDVIWQIFFVSLIPRGHALVSSLFFPKGIVKFVAVVRVTRIIYFRL